MWKVSRVLNNISPFADELLQHSEAQLDFILEMYAKDNPEEVTFVRADKPTPLTATESMAEWECRLLGKAKQDFWGMFMPSAAVLQKAAQMTQAGAKLAAAAKQS